MERLLEVLGRLAGFAGFRLAGQNDAARTAIMWAGGGIFVLLILGAIAQGVGRATVPNERISEAEAIVRGGCLLVLVIGGGLIFLAAVTWAWRYLTSS